MPGCGWVKGCSGIVDHDRQPIWRLQAGTCLSLDASMSKSSGLVRAYCTGCCEAEVILNTLDNRTAEGRRRVTSPISAHMRSCTFPTLDLGSFVGQLSLTSAISALSESPHRTHSCGCLPSTTDRGMVWHVFCSDVRLGLECVHTTHILVQQ